MRGAKYKIFHFSHFTFLLFSFAKSAPVSIADFFQVCTPYLVLFKKKILPKVSIESFSQNCTPFFHENGVQNVRFFHMDTRCRYIVHSLLHKNSYSLEVSVLRFFNFFIAFCTALNKSLSSVFNFSSITFFSSFLFFVNRCLINHICGIIIIFF